MELRAEPRFETRSTAVLEVFRDKVHTYDTTITEVSGIGLRIEMAEELAVGQTIRLLVDNYYMFAQVRRCLPSEAGFTIGVERIDAWNGPPAGNASIPSKTAIASPVKVVGRPKLTSPLDNLRGAALKAIFADPRWRKTQSKYQTVFIAVGCIALAGWAGFGAGVSLHGKPRVATQAKTESAPKSAAAVAPPKTATPSLVAKNLVASEASGRAVAVPPLQKVHVDEPTVQKAVVAAPPKLAAPPAIAPASRISIKASDISWVTACADGSKVLDMLLTKGYAGGVSFSRQATLRFGNAGAIELAVGNQPAAKLGQPGEVRTIKVTPAGYELMTIQTAFNCNLH
jgi:Domain of unknown function (DUF4115)/PilZ domain